MATLGRAFIEVVADTSKFGASIRRDLARSLGSVDKAVNEAGARAGRNFTKGFDDELTKGVRKATEHTGDALSAGMKKGEGKAKETAADIAHRIGFEFDKGGDLAGLKFVDSISRQAKKVGLVLERAGRDAQGRFIVGVNPNNGLEEVFRETAVVARRAGRQTANAFRTELARGLSGLRKDLKDLQKNFSVVGRVVGGFLGSIGSELNAIARGSAGFATIASGALAALPAVLSLAQSLLDLTGILAAVPAAAAAFGIALLGVKLSLQGFSAAIKATSDKQLEKALNGMGAGAKRLALQLRALKPAFNTVRQSAQEAFVKGLGPIERITKLLPTLRTGFAGVGTALGGAGKQLLTFATTPATLATLNKLFGATAGALKSITAALTPLLTGLGTLADTTAPFIQRFGDGLGKLITQFGNFLTASAKSGKATEWINTALATLSQLGRILGNVGSIFNSFLTAGQSAGGGLLATLEKVTGQLDKFFKSAEGTAALNAFFAALAQIGTAISPIFATLAGGIGKIAPLIASAITTIAPPLDTFLSAFANALVALGPGLDALASAIGDTLIALAPALTPLANALSQIVVAVAPLLPALGSVLTAAISGLSAVIGPLASVLGVLFQALAPIIKVFGDALLVAVQTLSPIIAKLADAFGRAMVPVIQALMESLIPVLPAFAQLITLFAQQLAPILPTLVGAFFQLAQALIPIAKEFGGQVLAAVLALAPLLPQLAQAAIELAVAFADLLTQLEPLLPLLLPIITSALPLLLAMVGGLVIGLKILSASIAFVSATIKAFKTVLFGLQNAAKSVFDAVKGAITGAWNTIRDKAAGIVSFIKGIPAKIAGVGLAIGAAIADGLSGPLDKAKGLINGLIRAFNLLPGPDINELANGAIVVGRRTVVVGEAGPEVVIPLTRPARAAQLAEQSGLIDILARGGLRGGGPQITINAPITVVAPNADPNLVAVKVAARLARLAVV